MMHPSRADRAAHAKALLQSRVAELEQQLAGRIVWPEWEIDYTNFRGERGVRRIRPTGRIVPRNEYHPQAAYLIEAYDVERNVLRTFDPYEIHTVNGIRVRRS